MDLIFFIFGTAILVFSGDLLVRAAVDLSLKMAISPMIVGLTVIAFGTSAPELLVGVQATWNGFGGLALGNIIGSNVTNVLLILGVPSLIVAVKSSDKGLIQNYFYMLSATLLFSVFLFFGEINFWQGIFLVFLLILFILQALFYNKHSKENLIATEVDKERNNLNSWTLIAFWIFGFIGLPLGAHIVITSAVKLAESIGVSHEVIGLTVVAIGTSLPELATSVAAAYRRQINLLLGNVIGSNMFNILGIAGAAALIGPLQLTDKVGVTSLASLLASSLILSPFIIYQKSIKRGIGVLFLVIYLIYIILLF